MDKWNISTKERMQLIDENVWHNPEDEWLDYNSNNSSDSENDEQDGNHHSTKQRNKKASEGLEEDSDGDEEYKDKGLASILYSKPNQEELRKKREEEDKEAQMLYNSRADDRDSQWVRNNLSKHRRKAPSSNSNSSSSTATTATTTTTTKNQGEELEEGSESDAMLNCPCCFALLCVDCQRHETWVNQYRAVFVRNCRIERAKEIR